MPTVKIKGKKTGESTDKKKTKTWTVELDGVIKKPPIELMEDIKERDLQRSVMADMDCQFYRTKSSFIFLLGV